MGNRTAVLVGATGLVGGHLLNLLLGDPTWGRVVVLARRPTEIQHEKLEWREVDFDQPAMFGDLSGCNDVFCALGTTIKKAGSKEAFRKVDRDYALAVAEAAQREGADQFLVVTAVGAKATSSVFYSRVKGELEEALKTLGYPRLWVLRPSFLLGERAESRPGEKLGVTVTRSLSKLMLGPFAKYRAIEARQVALAMCSAAKGSGDGVHVVEGEGIRRLAGEGQAGRG